MKKNSIIATIILMVSNFLTKIVGLLRDVQLAAIYGAGIVSDAYIIAMNIPNIIFAAIGVALSTVYIPLYSEIRETQGEKAALKFSNNIINIITILGCILTTLGLIFTEQIVNIFAVGFDGKNLDYAINFTRILLPSILFIGLNNIFGCFLQLKGKFTAIGFATVPQNIIVIISMFISYKLNNVYILLWGTLFAIGVQVIYYYPFMKKGGYVYNNYINLRDPNLKKVLYLVGPVFLGASVNQINILMNRTLASTLDEGSISALNFADKLNGFVTGVFIISISTVIYPIFSKLSAQKIYKELYETVVRIIRIVLIVTIPISIYILLFSEPIVELLFKRGTFDEIATTMTSQALIGYAFSIIGIGVMDILLKAFYSVQDTKTPVKYGLVSVTVNIVLSMFLINILGILGLALAASIASIFTACLLFLKLRKKIGGNSDRKNIKSSVLNILKVLISSLIFGVIVDQLGKLLQEILSTKGFIELICIISVPFVVGVAIYMALLYLLKVEETDLLLGGILKKIKLGRDLKQ
ncbi:murein biosynthesis integral membrane protein MurJ [Bacillus mobilis]|uniref:murein biosynthesis integral membrane protein MurJ n=3 Tax=Bacillus mobilis TaxID=2026190 RepID=UPI0039EE39FF